MTSEEGGPRRPRDPTWTLKTLDDGDTSQTGVSGTE